jgi:hypothetical protein
MEPKDWITLAGIAATTLISIVVMVVNSRREKQQQERDDRVRKEQQEREDKLRREQEQREVEKENRLRTYSPHIEFEIKCNFYGPEQAHFVAEFLLIVCNRGSVQQKFKDIQLRVRGIESDQPLSYWQGNEPRLAFPVKIVDNTSILPESYNFFFVEPGIEQVFTYVTRVSSSIKYILVHAEFEYDQFTPHTTERTFAVKVGG